MAPVITGLPARLTEETVTHLDLLVHRVGPVEVYYTPFDWVNTGTRVVLVGICPGRHQMLLAVREARRVLLEGGTVAHALKAADATASFAGQTRGNLVRMLDRIGVHDALEIASTASLFDEHQHLADSNSMCNFTVQVDGENYRGSPRVERIPFLRTYVTQVLGATLEMMPDALVVPLGKAVSAAVTTLLVNEGLLDPRRCLLGFPHPSGSNNGRVAAFLQAPGDLAARVRAWFGVGGGGVRSPELTRSRRALASNAGSPPASDKVSRWHERQHTTTAVHLAPGLQGRLQGYAEKRDWPVTRAAAFLIEVGLDREEPGTALSATPRANERQPHNQANVRAKRIYLADLLSGAGTGLDAAGLGPVRPHGHSRWIALPPDLSLAAHSEVRLMASQSYTRLTLVTLAPSGNPQESEALLELLRERYAEALAAHLPAPTQVLWHARTTADVIDFASLRIHNGGYTTGDPSAAADWVVTCCQAWVGALRADPIGREELDSAKAKRPTR
jgi:hypothetical protein